MYNGRFTIIRTIKHIFTKLKLNNINMENMITINSDATKEEWEAAVARSLELKLPIMVVQVEEEEEEPALYPFADVVDAIQDGSVAYREAWGSNGGHFVYKAPQGKLAVDTTDIIETATMPQLAKIMIMKRLLDDTNDETFKSVIFDNQLMMVHPNNKIYQWAPSVADMSANDWIIEDLTLDEEDESSNGKKAME
tara:strand:- start:797 stop:1381 length:585 start_codon:yes stop_codon:yes gene_type:complete